MPTQSLEPFEQIITILFEHLEQSFQTLCPNRYGGPLHLRRRDGASSPDTVIFGLEDVDDFPITLSLEITHVGGNVYDIEVSGEVGPNRSFTYSAPATLDATRKTVSSLGTNVARHVLDRIEKQIGHKVLRMEAASDSEEDCPEGNGADQTARA